MNQFFKNISIYGILPLVGKFIGFFLVPIYARVFQSSEFGQIELVTTLVNFIVYFINLEFYTSIGRYFYEKESLDKQKLLISTGLWMTVLSTIIVVTLCLLFQDYILQFYLSDIRLRKVLTVGILWLSLDGIATYLNVIPRYTKKAKAYVVINSISILLRVLSTIFFILYLKTGIIGVLYGHITGTVIVMVLNAYLSKKFLSFSFDKNDAKRIFNYAIPLIPGLIVTGMWLPTIRKCTEVLFSVSVVGLYSFATRITSLTTMFKSALMNAWRPLMYENMKDPSFFSDIKKNSSTISFILLSIGCFVSLFSYEICLIVGTEEYLPSFQLIPFLCFAGYLQSATQLRGFWPLINNKTYIQSLVIIFSFFIAVGCLFIVKDHWGLYGLGLSIALYEIMQYVLLYNYTRKQIQKHCVSLVINAEYIIIALFILVTTASFFQLGLLTRSIIGTIVAFAVIAMDFRYYHILRFNKKRVQRSF